MTTEFAADKLTVSTTKSTIGLTRWEKDYMISFFPVSFRGHRLIDESGINVVYDLFLTNEQVEAIVDEYNKKNGIFSE